jgi:transposase
VRLDKHRDEINRYLAKGISKRAIAKLLDCSKSNLYNWLEKEGLNKKKPKAKPTETKT